MGAEDMGPKIKARSTSRYPRYPPHNHPDGRRSQLCGFVTAGRQSPNDDKAAGHYQSGLRRRPLVQGDDSDARRLQRKRLIYGPLLDIGKAWTALTANAWMFISPTPVLNSCISGFNAYSSRAKANIIPLPSFMTPSALAHI